MGCVRHSSVTLWTPTRQILLLIIISSQQTRFFFHPHCYFPSSSRLFHSQKYLRVGSPSIAKRSLKLQNTQKRVRFFSAFFRLYIIVNKLLLWYHKRSSGMPPTAFALSKFSKLLNLVDELPDCLTQKDDLTNVRMMFL